MQIKPIRFTRIWLTIKRHPYLLILSFFPIFFLNLGKASLFSFDEAWYAEVARNILKTQNPFLLFWNGDNFLYQPPLGFWLMALSYLIFGVNEFSARFFSALLGFASLGLLYHIGSQLFNKRVGFLSSLMLGTSVWFVIRARSANLDAILVFFILLNFFLVLKVWTNRKYLFLLAFSFACLLLIKYWIGLGIGPIVLYFLIKDRKKIKRKDALLAFLIFLIFSLPFYLINFLNYGLPFLNIIKGFAFRGGGSQLKLHFKLPLFYLHMGIREWYYPGLIAFFGSLVFIKKEAVMMIYLYILCFFLPFIISGKTEIWHLIPLYPGIALLIFSFTDNLLNHTRKFLPLNICPRIKKLAAAFFIIGGLFLSLKQVKEFWLEVMVNNLLESEDARIAKKAVGFKEPLFFTDLYFPTAVFYSQKELHFVGETTQYLGKKTRSLRELFDNLDQFILLTTKDALQEEKISEGEFKLIAQEGNKLLIRKNIQ